MHRLLWRGDTIPYTRHYDGNTWRTTITAGRRSFCRTNNRGWPRSRF
jgi:hypothetical protein